ncbi:MAG: GTP-binding protein [Acutalibacteraceae bacterium]|nr:GTP-binding protein [Acutalibacteraceae bacterium]
MTKIDIFSGFLGAGKTTLIKKLLSEAFSGEQIVIIENEFGEIGIDGGFLKEAGVQITEMNQGCICCSLVGDFGTALKEVIDSYHPDRILIEPSGVGKLSDVIKAVKGLNLKDIVLNSYTAVADATKVKIYMKNFGEFYNNQIENAGTIILSRTDNISEDKLEKAVHLIREHNENAVIVTTPWDSIDGKAILSAMERTDSLENDIEELHHHHHHHEECDDEHCDCHQHHHHECDDEDCECHNHKHHHEHEHHHDGECSCGCGHEHHHHADEVFTSFGRETVKKFSKEQLEQILNTIDNDSSFGMILRAKGILPCTCGAWLHFDYVPGEINVRIGQAGVIGRLCVIGKDLDENKLTQLFSI